MPVSLPRYLGQPAYLQQYPGDPGGASGVANISGTASAQSSTSLAFTAGVLSGTSFGPSLTTFPSLTLYPTDGGAITAPPVSGLGLAHVRDRPRLALHIEAISPNGRSIRWGWDEPDPTNVVSGLSFSSTVPGGYEQLDAVLPRDPRHDYSDLRQMTTLRVLGAGGEPAGEYRLEGTPRSSGDQMSISPSAVGWQAHLEDNQDAQEIYVDRDLSNWGDISVELHGVYGAAGFAPSAGSVLPGQSGGMLVQQIESSTWESRDKPYVSNWYDGRGVQIGSVYYGWLKNAGLPGADGDTGSTFDWSVNIADDLLGSNTISTGDLQNYGPGGGSLQGGPGSRFAYVVLEGGPNGDTGRAVYALYWASLAVYGNTGILLQQALEGNTNPPTAPGVFASDVITHAVDKFAPLLNHTPASISRTSYVIPHLAFLEPTTAAEIIRTADSFHLRDWGVWDDKTFWYQPRGGHGKRWRARIAPAQLSEAGPQIDRLWNGVVVRYSDVDGSTRSVGPPGSFADLTNPELVDLDTANPATRAGINRWAILDAGMTSTPAAMIQVGIRFLEESRLINTSGSAQLVGTVQDDHGTDRPYWQVRAGDYISFVDASDTSYRRIVRASHDVDSRTCSVDLDAPPQALDALLARFSASLVGIGA